MNDKMKVTIRCFSLLKYETGKSILSIECPVGSDTETVYQQFISNYPGLKDLPIRTAVNKEYISEKIELYDGDEISFIPPVSGG
ncbi:MAG: MoaD/ThiS family protein [Candidatus Marinimicrobia bacterium]|jgi:molybdopterin converting factor small subunit|nr:MoaD/ThiS family protein [Candidatus Neomarinimicrobiota bacterium]MBT3633823.1 MoaD/ThiS family protein [Candidatus Neomarinimicrobiota bacterium]MBT3682615.1 MoaD/ThiS family protein [Candidatus Neomarinimicrobiota bacterium]MBT3759379.1 MoaD/ThiS family protein [Candidatus Neomarinimicrobiota bacterium]MBT3894613.1 MoaD/ThiS family protein [Candidatus Neomarinimicrobiota bacterium]